MFKSRKMRCVGNVICMGDMRNAYRILVGTPEGKRALGRRGCRWENNIRMNLRVIGWEDVSCIHLVQDRD
jgi:hypothetical protein